MISLYIISTLPHILYALIWLYPLQYIKFINKCNFCYLHDFPLKLLYITSLSLKQIQLLYIFYNSFQNNTLYFYFNNFIYIKFILIIFGQILNLSVYNKLGIKGVYYGNKLGYNTKWVIGFPFNICNNPQYIGSCLSYIGLYGICDIYYILYINFLYIASVYIEQ